MEECDPDQFRQKWRLENYDPSKLWGYFYGNGTEFPNFWPINGGKRAPDINDRIAVNSSSIIYTTATTTITTISTDTLKSTTATIIVPKSTENLETTFRIASAFAIIKNFRRKSVASINRIRWKRTKFSWDWEKNFNKNNSQRVSIGWLQSWSILKIVWLVWEFVNQSMRLNTILHILRYFFYLINRIFLFRKQSRV